MDAPRPYASRSFEIETIAYWIRNLNPRQVYLEIGSFQGGGTRYFGHAMSPGATLIAVDAPMGSQPGATVLRATIAQLCDEGYDAHVVIGDSHAARTRDRVLEILGGRRVDAMLIDGDHTPRGVMADSADYVPLVRPGGLVVFHDLGPCVYDPTRAQRFIDAIWPVWKALAYANRRKMIVQEHCGYGLVWIDAEAT